MRFFVGLHHPSDAHRFTRCMVSVNRLRGRISDFAVNEWIMDSGAFTEIVRHGEFRTPLEDYAKQIVRWSRCGQMLAAVSQDYPCEPFTRDITGMSVDQHQVLTVERYHALRIAVPYCNLMPVLQGWQPGEYARHVEMYGDLLGLGAWVGVGSVCQRNGNPSAVASILSAIKRVRPDLRLHGFGLKLSALADYRVRSLLYSTDSMAWSFAARKQGREANSWREAQRYVEKVAAQPVQLTLEEANVSEAFSGMVRCRVCDGATGSADLLCCGGVGWVQPNYDNSPELDVVLDAVLCGEVRRQAGLEESYEQLTLEDIA